MSKIKFAYDRPIFVFQVSVKNKTKIYKVGRAMSLRLENIKIRPNTIVTKDL